MLSAKKVAKLDGLSSKEFSGPTKRESKLLTSQKQSSEKYKPSSDMKRQSPKGMKPMTKKPLNISSPKLLGSPDQNKVGRNLNFKTPFFKTFQA